MQASPQGCCSPCRDMRWAAVLTLPIDHKPSLVTDTGQTEWGIASLFPALAWKQQPTLPPALSGTRHTPPDCRVLESLAFQVPREEKVGLDLADTYNSPVTIMTQSTFCSTIF